jgi:hypothetical protein
MNLTQTRRGLEVERRYKAGVRLASHALEAKTVFCRGSAGPEPKMSLLVSNTAPQRIPNGFCFEFKTGFSMHDMTVCQVGRGRSFLKDRGLDPV